MSSPSPVRVAEVQRDRLVVLTADGPARLPLPAGAAVAVGDWVLLAADGSRVAQLVPRRSLLSRRAAGRDPREQLVAANVDTLFVVTSCNADFNPSRLERYLAMAADGGVEAVLLLTKADLCDTSASYVQAAAALAADRPVLALDARAADVAARLAPWLGPGRTVAFAGSSGVGKSTLVNALTGTELQRTAGIREQDARGRHTTTLRRLVGLPGGAWVIDTPGMRELALGDAGAALGEVFDDLARLATDCRFRDCRHGDDGGCALRAAVSSGALESRRLASFLKLRAETERAERTTAERREEERRFGRLARRAMQDKRSRRGR